MIWYDKNKIIETSNGFEVAQALGLKMRKSGSKYFILCPGHIYRKGTPDSHDTNAYITKHGYCCKSCGCAVNTINMTMEVKGCSFMEALDFVADLYGGKDLFIDETKSNDIKIKRKGKEINYKKINIINWEEQLLLGLNPKYEKWLNPIQCYAEKPEEETIKRTCYKDKNTEINEWLVSESRPIDLSLSSLAQNNYLAYLSLITRKCLEKLDIIDSVISEFKDAENSGEEYAVSINYILNQKRNKIWKILDIHSKEIDKMLKQGVDT